MKKFFIAVFTTFASMGVFAQAGNPRVVFSCIAEGNRKVEVLEGVNDIHFKVSRNGRPGTNIVKPKKQVITRKLNYTGGTGNSMDNYIYGVIIKQGRYEYSLQHDYNVRTKYNSAYVDIKEDGYMMGGYECEKINISNIRVVTGTKERTW